MDDKLKGFEVGKAAGFVLEAFRFLETHPEVLGVLKQFIEMFEARLQNKRLG